MDKKSSGEWELGEGGYMYFVFGWVIWGPMIYLGGKTGVLPVLVVGIVLAALWVIAWTMVMRGNWKERRDNGPPYHRGS